MQIKFMLLTTRNGRFNGLIFFIAKTVEALPALYSKYCNNGLFSEIFNLISRKIGTFPQN